MILRRCFIHVSESVARILPVLILLSVPVCALSQGTGQGEYFHTLGVSHGLSDNHVLQMLQLSDGRMAIKTQKGINLYEEPHFRFLPLQPALSQLIRGYHGQSHLYEDSRGWLWVKDYQKVYAVDLRHFRLVPHPLDSLSSRPLDDVFVDSQHEVWGVSDRRLVSFSTGVVIALEPSWGELQDMDVDRQSVYAFCSKGVVAVYSLKGRLQYVRNAYGRKGGGRYEATSLVVKSPQGIFYQIKTGGGRSAFLRFDPSSRQYQQLFACDYILHTLNMSSDRQALVSSQRGYLMFDFRTGTRPREVRRLALPDGTSLTTGVNTVYRDREGAVWLGTYHDGLIYVSPLLGLFFTADRPWWKDGGGMLCLFLLAFAGVAAAFRYRRRRRCRPTAGCPEEAEVPDTFSGLLADASPPDEFFDKAMALVDSHLSDSSYGVEQLASDLCMERTGLYKKMVAQTGETPVAMIRRIRLERAAELLKKSDGRMTVNEIAERTGFSSSSYFSKCFRERYGVKPSEYR